MNLLAWLVVRHPRAVLVASALVLAGLVPLSVGAFPLLKSGGFEDPQAPSSRAEELLDRTFGGGPNLVFLVTTTRPGSDVDSPGVAAAVTRNVVDPLERDPNVGTVTSYWATGAPPLRARDGRSGLVTVHVTGDEDQVEARATAIIEGVTAVARTQREVTVRAGGELGVDDDLGEQVVTDLAVAEAVAVPLTLVLLLVAFGSLVAALLPLAVGLFAVAGAFAVLFVVGSVTDVSIYAINLTTGLGLGLAIDYALLIVNRFREELGRGSHPALAVVVTLQTAGRTVLVSSGIVAVGLLAMLAFPLYFLRSFGYAGTGVVVIAMLASVVSLPAALVLLGDRVNAGRVRRSRPVRAASESSPFWTRLTSAVMRRPLLVGIPVAAVLLGLAAPVGHIAFGTPDDRVLPLSAGSRQVGDELRRNFGGSSDAEIRVVLTGIPTAADVGIYAGRLSTLAGVAGVRAAGGGWVGGRREEPAADPAFARRGVQFLALTGPPDGASAAAQDLVRSVRTLRPPPGASAVVGGAPATLVDAKRSIANGLVPAAGWIAASTFLLLFLFTGSVVVPIKALLLNVLSLATVFGAVVWIFQDGNLSPLLGFTPGPIDTAMPVLLFCIAFGLSMDYEVFLLSRIKEEYDRTGDNTAAVVAGLARTGRIVTTSAALLAITFFAFGLSQVSFLKLFGIGTALAVVLDATLVRGLLVPALMRLAGRGNWWSPAPLRRLHDRIGISEGEPGGDRGGRHSARSPRDPYLAAGPPYPAPARRTRAPVRVPGTHSVRGPDPARP